MSKLLDALTALLDGKGAAPPPAAAQAATTKVFTQLEALKATVQHELGPAGQAWLDAELANHLGPFGMSVQPVVHQLEGQAMTAIGEMVQNALTNVHQALAVQITNLATGLHEKIDTLPAAVVAAMPAPIEISGEPAPVTVELPSTTEPVVKAGKS